MIKPALPARNHIEIIISLNWKNDTLKILPTFPFSENDTVRKMQLAGSDHSVF